MFWLVHDLPFLTLLPPDKALGRAQAEKEVEKVKEREYERNHSRGSEKSTHMERASGKERISERERSLEREMGVIEGREGQEEMIVIASLAEEDMSCLFFHLIATTGAGIDLVHLHQIQELEMRCLILEILNKGCVVFLSRDDEDDSVAKMKAVEEALEVKQKQKPTFELSGKLAAETNRVRGVILLSNEPPDARKPDIRWQLYVFKAGEVLNEPIYTHRQSCYLFVRERRVADIPTDHPSCSKQHAVI